MADRKDCAFYADCTYLNDIGMCPYWCLKYRHRDEVRVVRCKDCKWWSRYGHGCIMGECGAHNIRMEKNDFCSYGERRTDG